MWNQKVRTRHHVVVVLALAAMLRWLPSHASAERPSITARSRAAQAYGKLPLRFEANAGQSGGQVKFLSRGQGYTLFLTSSEAVLALDKSALHMHLLGANANAEATAFEKLPGTVNYFIGNDPTKWRTNVPTYAKVKYRDIYPGVDLLYYGNQKQLEYDLVVAPGVDPRVARLGISGASKIWIDPSGDLLFETSGGIVRFEKPVAYQRTQNGPQSIDVRYALGGDGQVTFAVGSYDHSKPLVIDPVLFYSTYLGGSGGENFGALPNGNIAVDSTGSAYVTGYTQSTNFPTVTPFQPSNGGIVNAFVTKLNPEGTAFVYSTYLGGKNQDMGGGIAIDSSGNAYVTGQTTSNNFPTTPGAFQFSKQSAGADSAAFVTKLNSTGSALLYSTYLSGSSSDSGAGIAVDSSGRASITGQAFSTNFPATPGAPQPTLGGAPDAFVTTLAADGSSLVFSTYLGGSAIDMGLGIALDPSGNIYITGTTLSSNFPLVNPLQPAYGGGVDAFVAKLDPFTSKLVYSTYLGGSGTEQGYGIAVDSAGSAYVTGLTTSTNFPTADPYQKNLLGNVTTNQNAFVTKLNPAGSALVYSTYLGASFVTGYGIAVDSTGAAYVTGITQGNFPLVGSLVPSDRFPNPFVTKFNPAGSALVYSTYLGGDGAGSGIAVDASGNAYVTGFAGFQAPFPTTPGAAQTTFGGGASNAFVVKVSPGGASVAAVKSSPNPSVFGEEVTFTATVTPEGVSSNTPTGTVVFDDGQTPFEILSLANGSASFNTGALSVGTHNITVSYGGDANFAASTSTILTQVVNQASTNTTLVGAPNPANLGQMVTLTATVAPVSPGAGNPTGTVTFKEGAATLGTGTVSSGVATLNISTLSAGSHTIIASYAGDINFTASASSGFAQGVILPAMILVNEFIKVTDTPTLMEQAIAVILVNESIKVTDTPTLMEQAIAVILVNESIKVTDTPTLMEQAIAVIMVSESITVTDAPALLLPAVINVAESITVADLPAFGPANVSGEVSVTSSGLVYSHLTRTFSGTVTVLNTSGQSIAGPIEIVLTNLTAGVTLVNATGTFVGNPYIAVLASGSLAAGQSANVAVRFSDPSNALIHFTPVVYSGSLN
jgi:hypothetical protein